MEATLCKLLSEEVKGSMLVRSCQEPCYPTGDILAELHHLIHTVMLRCGTCQLSCFSGEI